MILFGNIQIFASFNTIILTVAILNNYNPPPPPRRNNKTAKKNSGKNRRVETLWIFSSWAGCRGVTVGRGGVTPPKVEKRCCCRQFANLQGNILHGRFSPTFAILRKKHIWWQIQIKKKLFNEHCSKASMFAEMYNLLENLYVFFSRVVNEIQCCKIAWNRLKTLWNYEISQRPDECTEMNRLKQCGILSKP